MQVSRPAALLQVGPMYTCRPHQVKFDDKHAFGLNRVQFTSTRVKLFKLRVQGLNRAPWTSTRTITVFNSYSSPLRVRYGAPA